MFVGPYNSPQVGLRRSICARRLNLLRLESCVTSDRALGYVVSRVIYQKYRCLGMSQSFCTAGRERDSIHESLLYKSFKPSRKSSEELEATCASASSGGC